MDPILIGVIGTLLMYVIIFAGMPIGFAMILFGFLGYAIIAGPDIGLVQLQMNAVRAARDYNMSCIPFFILLGEFAFVAGMVQSSYRAANTWLGRLPGGLAMATVAGAGLFSTVSGSSVACAATMTRIALPDLLKAKYDNRLAVGSLCAGGTLGSLVPPGTAFLIYAMLTDASIGALFMASLIPGILLTVMYFVQIYIQCKIDPNFGPPGPSSSWREKLFAFKDVYAMLLLFAIVMVGMWFGVYTPNEAATMGAVGALIFALIYRKLNRKNFYNCILEAIKTTGMVFIILIGAKMFTLFITISQVMPVVANWITSLNMSPTILVIFICLVYFALGTAFDTIAMIMLTLPILLPILDAANIDLVWFGVLVVTQMELSQITPPVGMVLFTVAGMVKDLGISMKTVFDAAWPYCFTMVAFNLILIFVPWLCLWLPSTMR